MYRVLLGADARKTYNRADRPLAQKIARCLIQLERDPHHHPNIKPLTGPLAGLFRYRIGDWRVIYRIEESQVIVIVIAIAPRGRVYP
jgi:mRNA interferase RelE/StbE